MQLLTDKTFENENIKKVINLIKKCIINGAKDNIFSFSKLVTYEEFEKSICNFIVSIMKTFLENSQYKDDKCVVVIKKLQKKHKGLFLKSEKNHNLLIINENVIKSIYNGDIEEFIVLFHELNHFKVKYDIKLGEINENITRIIKEKLIRQSSIDPFEEHVTEDYYCDNYDVYSEEVYVNLQAKRDFISMLKAMSKNPDIQEAIVELFQSEYKEKTEEEIKKYNNHIRDFSANLNFNSYYLSYDEAFDLLINDNLDWLKYPQIALEYYIDGNIVKKRSVEQLNELLNSSNNPQEKLYINFLINNCKKTANNKKI